MYRFAILITLLAVMILSACGRGADAEPTATRAEAAPTAMPEPTATEPAESADASPDEVILVPTAAPAEEASAEKASAEEKPPEEVPEADVQTESAPVAGGEYANTEQGIASYLSDALHGAATANGATYDKNEFVAAHKDLPFDTQVRVTNLANGKSVIVTVIDRMPANNPHLIDVSYVAAVELEMLDAGNIEASVEWNE